MSGSAGRWRGCRGAARPQEGTLGCSSSSSLLWAHRVAMSQLMGQKHPIPARRGNSPFLQAGSGWLWQPRCPACPALCLYLRGKQCCPWGSGLSILVFLPFAFPLPSLGLAAAVLVPEEGTGRTNGSPSFVVLCDLSRVAAVVLPSLGTLHQFPLPDLIRKAAGKESAGLGWCIWSAAHAPEVWGKEPAQMRARAAPFWVGCAQPQSPSVRELNSAGTKLGLGALQTSLLLVTSQLANLQNKIYFYLCSSMRTDKELIFQGFSWTCISLASISEGKSWGYSQLQEVLLFPQLIKIKLLLVEKMLQKCWIKMGKFIILYKKNCNNYYCIEILSHIPHALIHQIVRKFTM